MKKNHVFDERKSMELSSAGVCGGYDRAQARETRDDGLERRDPAEDGLHTFTLSPQDTPQMSWRIRLLYILPSVLFFSYYPIIPLSTTPSMNLELSLPLFWLALFTLLSLPTLPKSLRALSTHFPKKLRLPLTLLLFTFPVYLTISILWSPNPLRGLLTAGIFWCIIISILTIVNLMLKKDIKRKIVKIFLASSVIISLFCWLQCILDIMNVPRDVTLLCEGCTYRSFGFPHPNGLAIEPQFMGNLLLAPCFLSLYLLFKFPKRRKLYLPITIFLVTTLFLTFSRGAIYAFLLGSSVLIVVNFFQKHRQILWSIPIILCSLLLSLLAQGTFAQLSPTTDTFASGISKSLSQLTLGHLNLGTTANEKHQEPPFEGGAEPVSERNVQPFPVAHCAGYEWSEATSTRAIAAEPCDDRREDGGDTEEWLYISRFSGYVPESTEVRVSLTNSALSSWQDYKLFGSGLGSSGTVLYEKGFTSTPKEIVQNEYATLLLELGIFGCALLLLALILLAKYIVPKIPSPARAYLLCLILSYSATLFFFSGLPNALHLYLLPALLFSLAEATPSSRKKH